MFNSAIHISVARSDTDLAINMLNCVSAILRAVEHDDAALIDSAFTALKNDASQFERVFHENLIKGVYQR